MQYTRFIIMIIASIFLAESGMAEDDVKPKEGGPPPAFVVTTKAISGMIHPLVEFVGSFYFPEVSEIASEVSGLVTAVDFEEGQRVQKRRMLIKLGTDLLEKDLESAESEHQKVLADFEKARADFRRMESLIRARSVSEQEFDDVNFAMLALEKKARSLEAEVERLRLEINKTAIFAPYSGIILKRHANRGEWISPGSPIATLARDDKMDVMVEVPQKILPFMESGLEVDILTGGNLLRGTIFAVIPSGDISTRTFPVKVIVDNPGFLAQGMEARVNLPAGEKTKSVIVPRDAVINAFGMSVVWTVREGVAQQIPVNVAAYEGMNAAVTGPGLVEGMDIVVKGNERLQPGQPVMLKE